MTKATMRSSKHPPLHSFESCVGQSLLKNRETAVAPRLRVSPQSRNSSVIVVRPELNG